MSGDIDTILVVVRLVFLTTYLRSARFFACRRLLEHGRLFVLQWRAEHRFDLEVQSLEVAGPTEVFGTANFKLREAGRERSAPYVGLLSAA